MTADGVRHLVVTGPMGVGKSTTAQAVAEQLRVPHRDSDIDLERLFRRDGRAIAQDQGIPELHRIEAAVLLGALASPELLVISAAASVVEDASCRAALRNRAFVVVLDLHAEVVVQRMATGDHRREMDLADVRDLQQRREPWLEGLADVRLDAVDTPADLVDQVLRAWRGRT